MKENPPGLVGEIAQFIFDASPMPVKEIAQVAAIGLLAGIAGRAYNVSGTGLNQYVLLIAKTGLGKEAIAGGISKLIKAVRAFAPTALDFVGPTEIASPQALTKWLARQPCIYSIVGEFGLKLKEMSAPRAPAHIAGLKRALLDLYHKSGDGNVMGAMAYSKREDNTPVINSPAFTLIGESTPERFYDSVNEDVVTDGLLPRFSVVEYAGQRQKLNKSHGDVIPSQALTNRVAELVAHCAALSSTGRVQSVSIDPTASAVLDRFEEFIIEQMNSERVIARELWNRAWLKAAKLAALIAVGCNYINPSINASMAQVACDEINAQTVALISRFSKGEVGAIEGNEERQYQSVVRVIAEYSTINFDKLKPYLVPYDMHHARIVPASYVQRRLTSTAAFRGQGGGSKAIDRCLQRLLDADELRQIPKQDVQKRFGQSCRAFQISKPELFLDALDK